MGEGAGLLGAAMIVRDEERHLAACLSSIAGVVDEIVVVDTGSTDASVEIAKKHGALVHVEPWQGDFSRARNAALDRVRAQWVLYIDADERLAPIARADVERLLTDTPHLAFRLLLRPRADYTAYREYRLWRNDPRIRFSGIIHEKVVSAIHALSAQGAGTIGFADLLLEHVGYEGDQRAKHLRNRPLLLAQVERQPDDVYSWWHLGSVERALGDADAAERAFERGIELVRAGVHPELGSLAFVDLISLRQEQGGDVGPLLGEARGRYPHHWLLVWLSAHAALEAGRYDDAIAEFEVLADVDPDTIDEAMLAYDRRMFGAFAHASIGLCHFRAGRFADAAEAYGRAAAADPDELEHRAKRELALAMARR